MKQHLTIQRLGRASNLCGRQLGRPRPGAQVEPIHQPVATSEVTCGWCLAEMQRGGVVLTADQISLVARSTRGRDALGEAEDEAMAELEEAE